MSKIVIESLVKKFGDVFAVDHVDLQLNEGEFVTLLGPSGCGKTTTLRCVAGLEKPDRGKIYIGEVLVTAPEEGILVTPEKRNIGMVFQSYAIWPNKTVFENVAFGLSIRKVAKEQIRRRVTEVLAQVQMEAYANRYATELSGGQQQRVAVARALAFNPRALLFDEPLSNLDAKLREDMRVELVTIQKKTGLSSLYVTHDQIEAMAISDRIAIMEKGKIVQIGSPEEIYNRPVNAFVAGFIGATNLVECQVVVAPGGQNSMGVVEFAGQNEAVRLNCIFSDVMARDGKVILSLRQERIKMWLSPPEQKENVFIGRVTHRAFLGDNFSYRLQVGDYDLQVKTDPEISAKPGEDVHLSIRPEDVIVLPLD